MAKVLALGLQRPAGPPPIGAMAKCPRCGAINEVEKDELHISGIFELSSVAKPGWLIRCGACGYSRVFIKQEKTFKK